MALNIKNEAVQKLVREAAARTGKTQTSVMEEALAAYLSSLDRLADDEAEGRRRKLARIRATVAELREHLDPKVDLNAEIEALYDENGLPA